MLFSGMPGYFPSYISKYGLHPLRVFLMIYVLREDKTALTFLILLSIMITDRKLKICIFAQSECLRMPVRRHSFGLAVFIFPV